MAAARTAGLGSSKRICTNSGLGNNHGLVSKSQVTKDGKGYATDKSKAEHSTAASGAKDTNVDPASTVVPPVASKADLAAALHREAGLIAQRLAELDPQRRKA